MFYQKHTLLFRLNNSRRHHLLLQFSLSITVRLTCFQTDANYIQSSKIQPMKFGSNMSKEEQPSIYQHCKLLNLGSFGNYDGWSYHVTTITEVRRAFLAFT